MQNLQGSELQISKESLLRTVAGSRQKFPRPGAAGARDALVHWRAIGTSHISARAGEIHKRSYLAPDTRRQYSRRILQIARAIVLVPCVINYETISSVL